MLQNDFNYLMKSFSKINGLSIRLYENENCVYYYSPTGLFPDPAIAELDTILSFPYRAGVITTSLFQHYGFVHLPSGKLLIIGPSAAYMDNEIEWENLSFLLTISESQKQSYFSALCCAPEAPEVTAEHIAWMLSFIVTAFLEKKYDVEEIYIDAKIPEVKNPIAHDHAKEIFNTYENTDLSEIVLDSYRFEQLGNLLVKHGQVERLQELFDSVPSVQAGKMASDTLRQAKNMFICSSTTMSRAAIEGGLDPQSAFKLTDLYIQKCELMRAPSSLFDLVREVAIDLASRVRSLNYDDVQDSKLFEACTFYIKKHLFSRISIQDIADEFGISRSYLSTQFHKQTGKTLTQFILDQKIIESKQLLLYTSKSISEIAMHLAFSSQSHFQNAFKKEVGVTPLEYRKQYR